MCRILFEGKCEPQNGTYSPRVEGNLLFLHGCLKLVGQSSSTVPETKRKTNGSIVGTKGPSETSRCAF